MIGNKTVYAACIGESGSQPDGPEQTPEKCEKAECGADNNLAMANQCVYRERAVVSSHAR